MVSTQPREPAALQRPAKVEVRPLKLLAVIDGSERTGRIIEHALALAQGARPVEVVLLGAVRAPPDGRLRGYGSFKRDAVHARLKEAVGQRAVSAAARRFDHQGVAHKDRIEVGDPVATILRVAAEEGADMVLVGDAPAGRLRRWLPRAIGLSLATVANQVAQLAPIPVVVVK